MTWRGLPASATTRLPTGPASAKGSIALASASAGILDPDHPPAAEQRQRLDFIGKPAGIGGEIGIIESHDGERIIRCSAATVGGDQPGAFMHAAAIGPMDENSGGGIEPRCAGRQATSRFEDRHSLGCSARREMGGKPGANVDAHLMRRALDRIGLGLKIGERLPYLVIGGLREGLTLVDDVARSVLVSAKETLTLRYGAGHGRWSPIRSPSPPATGSSMASV